MAAEAADTVAPIVAETPPSVARFSKSPRGARRPRARPAPDEGVRFPRPRPRPRPEVGGSARLFPEEPELFAWFARRFAPGEATLWSGPASALEPLLETLYAGCAVAGGLVSLIEGANRFHPYRVGDRGRALGLDPTTTLERIRLARAFTAYQLVALVDAWSREARRTRPRWLVAHELPELFWDSEFPEEERGPLLRHVAETLRAIAEETELPLLVVAHAGLEGFPGLREAGPRFYDWVRVRPGASGAVALDAHRERAALRLVPRPPGQHGLEDFVPIEGEEVTTLGTWGVPPRRTARRWRSA
jgi:hypothetical protein